MRPSSLAVGVTGGIGSGKSIVCEIFGVLGVPFYNADKKAKFMMENDASVRREIIKIFGIESYSDESLNRTWLAREVFSNEDKLSQLNGIIHPNVASDFNNWWGEQNHPYVIKEAALLVEAGSYQELDYLILVTAPKEVRMQRVLKRDSYRDANQVESIMDKQLSDEDKMLKADFVLPNDGSTMILPTLLKWDKIFKSGGDKKKDS